MVENEIQVLQAIENYQLHPDYCLKLLEDVYENDRPFFNSLNESLRCLEADDGWKRIYLGAGYSASAHCFKEIMHRVLDKYEPDR